MQSTRPTETICTLPGTLERLDVPVHGAGYFPRSPRSRRSARRMLERTLAVNLSALFWPRTQGTLPLFARQGGGNVLATSSVTGLRAAHPGLGHYAASKFGVNGFIRSAAQEPATPSRARSTALSPADPPGDGQPG